MPVKAVGIKEIRKEYWKYTLPMLVESVPELFYGKKITDRSAIDSKAPQGGHIYLSCIATTNKAIVGVYIRTGKKETAKAIFDLLLLRKKEIEAAVSTKNIEWVWTENDLDANIRCMINASILSIDDWERCRLFHSKTSKELYDLLFKY